MAVTLIDRYLCRDLAWPDPDTTQRASLVVRFSLAATPTALVFAAVHLAVLRYPMGGAVLLTAFALSALAPVVLRRTRRTAPAGNLLAAALFLAACSLSFARDDLPVPPLMFCAVIPLLTGYLAGRRSSLVWAGLSLLAAGFFTARLLTGRAKLAPELEDLTQAQRAGSDALALVALLVLVLVIAVSVDAARRAAERERQQMLHRVEQLRRLQSLGMLAAGVAHEINNPLSWVSSNLQFIRRKLTAEDQLEAAGDAIEGCDRIRRITDDLRQLSRSQAQEREPVAVNAVVESALKMASHETRFRARLVKELTEVPQVIGEKGRLGELFLNLVVNAAQAIEVGRVEQNEIRVRSFTAGDEVCVEVADTGSGIAAEHLPHLFDPFFTTKQAGVGLGLSLCHEIVRSHGGRIEVDSAPGRGSRFVVRLPVARVAPASREPPRAEPGPARHSRILFVDDEPLAGLAVRRLLEGEHEVVCVTTVAQAQRRLGEEPAIDLVVTDLVMPDATGIELFEWLKANRPALASTLVFFTAGALSPGTRAFLDGLANPQLSKPADLNRLREVILAAVGPRA